MRTLSISLSEELYEKLKLQVPTKHVSKFVANAIDNELSAKTKLLRDAYIAARNDKVRNQEIEEWDVD